MPSPLTADISRKNPPKTTLYSPARVFGGQYDFWICPTFD